MDDKGGHGLLSEKKPGQLIQGLMLWLHKITKILGTLTNADYDNNNNVEKQLVL